ncbi:hypothetical protein ET475_11850 [Microbacterium protaetiae]|uniref:Asparagine synthetase domain-containing protein n=1 Tax=Microbacterium protaetiae TaxID=2509458 RepID=A0A4P6EGN0_9MICO|nr:hypothetical protein [Microbacterium protaetiae]QAY60613.1 hypothetical protein ET475_11850 [Microbacterium protaetiae]
MMETKAWHEAAVLDSELTPREDLEHLLFARGYLLSRAPRPAPADHWLTHKVGGWYLSRDPRLGASFIERDGRSLLLVGSVMDLRSQVSGAQVVAGLLKAWETARSDLDEALEWLAGRYVILGQSAEGDFFQTDATGMLSASYSAEHRMIASHQNLLAETAGGLEYSPFGEPDWLRQNHAYTFPGMYTRFAGVYMVPANTEVNVRDFTIRRVGPFPSRPGQPRAVASSVLHLMRRQHPFLSRSGGGPLVSLTAGLDSRITTAALRELVPETLFFTYKRHRDPKSVSDYDLQIATRLAAHLGLNHRGYSVIPLTKSAPLEALLERSTFVTHGRSVAASYLRELPPDRLHVRSNLYEIARGFFRNREHLEVTADLFARLLTSDIAPPRSVIEAFEEMAEATGILEVDGYEPLDLFYWEHRMVSWFNKVLLESDIAHDTHILVNSRVILRMLLSVPLTDRRAGRVFDHIVEIAWPEAYDLPVNGKLRTLPASAQVAAETGLPGMPG